MVSKCLVYLCVNLVYIWGSCALLACSGHNHCILIANLKFYNVSVICQYPPPRRWPLIPFQNPNMPYWLPEVGPLITLGFPRGSLTLIPYSRHEQANLPPSLEAGPYGPYDLMDNVSFIQAPYSKKYPIRIWFCWCTYQRCPGPRAIKGHKDFFPRFKKF